MAIFEFTETARVEAAWYVAWNRADWLAIVYTDAEGRWTGRYRYRYYTDPDNLTEAFNTDDEKSVYTVTPKRQDDEPGELVRVFTLLSKHVADTTHADIHETIDVRGSVDDYLKILTTKPWSHVKVTPPEPKVAM